MPAPTATIAKLRARKARADQLGNIEAANAIGTELRSATAQQYLERLVSEAPPLPAETRQKLAVILLTGPAT